MVLANYTFASFLWDMLLVFAFVIWFWLLITVFRTSSAAMTPPASRRCSG